MVIVLASLAGLAACGSNGASGPPPSPCTDAMVPATLHLTVSGFSKCSCFNGTFTLTPGTLPGDLAGVRAAAVGEGTARALREVGINVDLVAPGTGAAALADDLVAAGAGAGGVWLPQAEAARSELGRRLRQAGAEVMVSVCYRTVAVPGLSGLLAGALGGGVDAVTLLSPSAAEAVIEAVGAGALDGVRVICVGDTTATALRRHGIQPVVAARGDAAGVAVAVAAALRR